MTSTAARLREHRGAALLLLALAVVGATALWGPRGALGAAPVWAFPVLVALAAAAALYAPWRGPGVGLGAVALAPAAVWLGPAAAAITALLARLAREAAWRRLRPQAGAGDPRRWGAVPARLGQVALATLAAVSLWRLLWPGGSAAAALSGEGLAAAGGLAGLYLATMIGLEAALGTAGGERLAWLAPVLALGVDLAALACCACAAPPSAASRSCERPPAPATGSSSAIPICSGSPSRSISSAAR